MPVRCQTYLEALKSRGLRIKGDDTPIAPGEFRDVDVGAGALRDNILPLPYKEPSATLYQLLGTIVEEGRRFAATADMKISDMSAQAPCRHHVGPVGTDAQGNVSRSGASALRV
jgi:hypothetical protein